MNSVVSRGGARHTARKPADVRQPVVFVGGDYAVSAILDEIANRLRERHIVVIRGRIEQPPRLTEYAPSEWPDLFSEAAVIVISTRTRATRAMLEAAPRLRGLVFPTIGTDSVKLTDAMDLGLVIGHGPTPENFTGMAESTVMLIAALFLDLPAKERMTRGNLPRPQHRDMRARLVRGRTIGLIGMGRIARAVVERLQGWGVSIIANDPHVPQADAPDGVKMVDMPTLLADSDLISIHVALADQGGHVIGAPELDRMKPGAYLINTSRGAAVDERALIGALQSGTLGGAALDVFEREPLAADSPLRHMDNVMIISHIVGQVREMHESFVNAAIENITRILRNERPLYVRNPQVLPVWQQRLARMDAELHSPSSDTGEADES